MKKLIVLLLLISGSVSAQYDATWESLDQRQTPEWFSDAKFGIFIHWGLYSVPSWATKSGADGFGSGYSEWYWQRLNTPKLNIHKEFVDFHKKNYGNASYQDFVQDFKAELFEPADWASIFKGSGAKYVVLTSKHHEGFTLWPSKQAWNWNALDVGPHRDLAGDLSKAVKESGLKMGFYYSLYEWYNPTYKTEPEKYVSQTMIPQLKDLVSTYKPDVLWADGEWDKPSAVWQSKEFLQWLYNDSPVKETIAINDRWGNDTKGKHGGFATSEYGHGGTDNTKSSTGFERPWEECRGMGESFGYSRNENLENYQTGESLVHQLIDIVSKGGNLLLNIGPTADGRIPVIMQERLAEIGAWLQVNGEAIYGTRKVQNAPEIKDVFLTQKGNSTFAICTKWKDSLEIKIDKNPKEIKMLGLDQSINFTYNNGTLIIESPRVSPNTIPCDYAWAYEIKY